MVLTEMDNASVSAAGETASQTNLLTNRFTHITVRLNRHYLLNYIYNYSYDRIVNTAEHELGHAIGLDPYRWRIGHATSWLFLQYPGFRCRSSPTIIQGRMSLKILAKSSGPQRGSGFLMLRLPLFNP